VDVLTGIIKANIPPGFPFKCLPELIRAPSSMQAEPRAAWLRGHALSATGTAKLQRIHGASSPKLRFSASLISGVHKVWWKIPWGTGQFPRSKLHDELTDDEVGRKI